MVIKPIQKVGYEFSDCFVCVRNICKFIRSVITHTVPKAMQDMWHKIVSEFFPTSGYEPTYEMDIEAYTEGNMGSPDYRSEIWVPVIKK